MPQETDIENETGGTPGRNHDDPPGEPHQCRTASTSDGGDLVFQAGYGAPGVGSAWECQECGREWSKVGGIFHDPDDHADILDRADVQ